MRNSGTPWRANNTEDQEAVERHAAFRIGVFSDPVYTTGDWPKIMTDTLPPAILPRFTEEEKKDLLGLSCSYILSHRSPPQGWAQCTSII
jgi:beta-glucosidase